MVEVSENPKGHAFAPEPLQFTPDLGKGGELFKGSKQAQVLVDAKFGAATVTARSIDIKTTDQYETYTDNGCTVTHGHKSDKNYDQLQTEGTAALNKPRSPGAPGAKDAGEQGTADKIVQNTLTLAKESSAQNGDEIQSIQGAFKGMDKDQTQRVIDSANKKLAESGSNLRYAQTQDGAVWLGYKKADGTYEASEYMRPPECSMG